jgi:hypothetical protein
MNPRFIEEMSWRMGEVYAAVTDQILINLARHFKYIQEGQKPTGSWEYQAKKLAEMGQVTRETEQIIINMLGGYDAELQKLLEASIVDGLKGVEKPLRQAAERGLLLGQGFLPPEVAPSQMQAFKAYYRQSADKLNLVNTVMLDSTRQAYQATVSDIVTRMSATQDILNVATGEVVTGVSSMNQAVRHGVMKMVENGITGFIDHGGHHWSPEAYVTMDVRTTMANTARAAVWERQEQYGNDLYQVSHHDGARPLCYPWQGKVISRDDFSREVEDDEGNTVHVYAQSETSYGEAAGLFGINCGHYPIPFIPGFSRIRPPEQNEEENAKEYEESQKQRALERKVREEKRDLAVLKAQGASDEEIKAQRDKVRQANANLTEFCDETGRAKRSGRITTPVVTTKDIDGGLEPPKLVSKTWYSNYPPVLSENVTTEYTKKEKPGVGSVTKESGKRQSVHQHELDIANAIVKQIGGDVTLIDNKGRESKRDMIWMNKQWELKKAKNAGRAEDRTKTAMEQLSKTGGNLIIDLQDDDFETSKGAVMHTVNRFAPFTLDIAFFHKGQFIEMLRYTKIK